MYIISPEPQYIVCIDQKYSDGLAYKIEKKGVGIEKKVMMKEWMIEKRELVKNGF